MYNISTFKSSYLIRQVCSEKFLKIWNFHNLLIIWSRINFCRYVWQWICCRKMMKISCPLNCNRSIKTVLNVFCWADSFNLFWADMEYSHIWKLLFCHIEEANTVSYWVSGSMFHNFSVGIVFNQSTFIQSIIFRQF